MSYIKRQLGSSGLDHEYTLTIISTEEPTVLLSIHQIVECGGEIVELRAPQVQQLIVDLQATLAAMTKTRAYPASAELHCEAHGYFDGRKACGDCSTANLIAWAKVWRAETCSRLSGCDVDGSHASDCSITANEREGCRLVDELKAATK